MTIFYDKDLRAWRRLSPSSRRLVKGFIWAGVVSAICLLVIATTGCAYEPIATAPSPTNTAVAVPASITLSAVNGIGSSAGKVYIAARVYDAAGRGVGDVALTFSTSAGTVVPAIVHSDALGQAQTVVTATGRADVSAQAGGIAHAITVTPVAVLDPVASPPPIINPIPSPLPTPPPSVPPPAEALRVDLTYSPFPATTGQPLHFSAFASAVIVSATWEFGDNTTAQTFDGRVTHTYDSPGTRTATVIVRDGQNRTAVGRVVVAVGPPVTATLGCTAGTSTNTPTSCNLTMYVSGTVATAMLASVAWQWADGMVDASTNSDARTHQYTIPGTYTVTATGTLADGRSATGQTTVVVPKP